MSLDIEKSFISDCKNCKLLASFYGCADRFESYVVENPEDRFSRDAAHLTHCLLGPGFPD